MSEQGKKWVKFAVRWGIAVAGIAWVVLNISFRDRVTVRDETTGRPVHLQVLNDAKEDDARYLVVPMGPDGQKLAPREVSREELWVGPDRKAVQLRAPDGRGNVLNLLAVRPGEVSKRGRAVRELLVEDRSSKRVSAISPAEVIEANQLKITTPMVEIGVNRMLREARPIYLVAAFLIFPVTYLLTAFRWHLLLGAMDIHIGQARTFVLNMVGSFFNSFMPGTTGGDLLKAIYASKYTTHRTRAVMSVIIDRVIGLMALMLLGGIMAAAQWDVPDCRRVAKASALLLGAAAAGLTVFYNPFLRRATGLDFVLKRLPLQKQVQKIVESLEVYGRRPGLVLLAMAISFPVHLTTIFSAMLAGEAFGLPLKPLYYWVVVPVIALVGAVPISPQGAGVMEVFAVALTRREGATVSQAFALTMSIRFISMSWNLLAGIFVLRGGYHAPTAAEQEAVESDAPEGGVPVEIARAPATLVTE